MSKIPGWVQIKSQPLANKILGLANKTSFAGADFTLPVWKKTTGHYLFCLPSYWWTPQICTVSRSMSGPRKTKSPVGSLQGRSVLQAHNLRQTTILSGTIQDHLRRGRSTCVMKYVNSAILRTSKKTTLVHTYKLLTFLEMHPQSILLDGFKGRSTYTCLRGRSI